jgi:mRNA interferase MazF
MVTNTFNKTDSKFKAKDVSRGDIYYVKLSSTEGSVQTGARPVVVVQNNKGNEYSSTLIVIPLTSKNKKCMPTHVEVGTEGGLYKNSTILCEQILTVDKSSIVKYIGKLSPDTMRRVSQALCISLSLQVA